MHPQKPNSHEDDSPATMAEMFRAFQHRQALEKDLEKHPPMAPAAQPGMDMPRESLGTLGANPPVAGNDAWKVEWLYPVDAWTLILGIDMSFLESGTRNNAEHPGAPDPSLLLKELERLRGLRILPSNAEGKIRRDDAVRVAYRLGYPIIRGTPAFDILVHIHGIVPGSTDHESPPTPIPDSTGPVWMGIIKAAVAALVFFPDLAATAGGADAPSRILDTIFDRHIFPPDAITSPGDRKQAELQIRQILLIVRATAADHSHHG